jgi:hypothetical protein
MSCSAADEDHVDTSPLGKAKAALAHAKELDPHVARREYAVLIEIASVQTQIAQAEALAIIAERLSEMCRWTGCITHTLSPMKGGAAAIRVLS